MFLTEFRENQRNGKIIFYTQMILAKKCILNIRVMVQFSITAK